MDLPQDALGSIIGRAHKTPLYFAPTPLPSEVCSDLPDAAMIFIEQSLQLIWLQTRSTERALEVHKGWDYYEAAFRSITEVMGSPAKIYPFRKHDSRAADAVD